MSDAVVSVASLAEVNPRTERPKDPSVEVSFVPMADVSESGRWTGRQTRRYRDVQAGYTAFRDGDVLFAKITPCMENGKGALVTGLASGLGFGSTEFHVLRAIPGRCEPDFLAQVLTLPSLRRRAESFFTGSAGQRRVPEKFFEHFLIPKYTPEEQRRIADLLSAVDERIQATERSIEKQQTVLASVSRRLLPDPGELSKDCSRLGSLAFIRRGASPRPIQDPRWFAEAGRGWVRISDVTKTRRFLDSTEQRLSPEGVACSVPVDPGQVIMSICATVGEARLVTTPVCVHDGFVVFNDHPDIEARYLRYLLERSKQWLLGQGQTGTQSNLNTDIVRALPIRLPSWERQVEVSNVLDALNELIEVEQDMSRKLRLQKVALLQRLLHPQ